MSNPQKLFSFYFYLYHFFIKIILFTSNVFLRFLPWKIQNYFKERAYPQLIWRVNPLDTQRRLWFHAASGEIEYIKPLIKLWKQRHPNDLLFLTYFSTSALPMIAKVPELDGWAPLPMDLPAPCENFIKALRPDLLVIARTDLWPTLLSTFNSMSSKPQILVASTWSEGAKKTQGFGRLFSLWCCTYLNKICVVHEADAQWIQRNLKNPPPLTITGDPRFDQVQYRLSQKRDLPFFLRDWAHSKKQVPDSSQGRVFIAGSTWPEDESVLLRALTKINLHAHRWIIVPHETTSDHINKIKLSLQKLKLPYQLWSEQKAHRQLSDASILIFDEKGWLAELYSLADFALIGGSFRRQVHSVMEALGCGVPVIVGPHYKNNREAIEFSKYQCNHIPLVKVAKPESDSLAQILNVYLGLETQQLALLKEEVRTLFTRHCGGTEKTYQVIKEALLMH